VQPLAALVETTADEMVFLDVNSIKPGQDWRSSITNAINECSVFIVCWCCVCNESDFIAFEIRTALQDTNKKLVPVLFCDFPLPKPLSNRQWIDLRGRIAHVCQRHDGPQISGGIARSPVRNEWRPKSKQVAGKVGGLIGGALGSMLPALGISTLVGAIAGATIADVLARSVDGDSAAAETALLAEQYFRSL
jgi:TIR domain